MNLNDLSKKELLELKKRVDEAIFAVKTKVKPFIDEDVDVEKQGYDYHKSKIREATLLLHGNEYVEFLESLLELENYYYIFSDANLLHKELMEQTKNLQENFYLVDGALEHEDEIDWIRCEIDPSDNNTTDEDEIPF